MVYWQLFKDQCRPLHKMTASSWLHNFQIMTMTYGRMVGCFLEYFLILLAQVFFWRENPGFSRWCLLFHAPIVHWLNILGLPSQIIKAVSFFQSTSKEIPEKLGDFLHGKVPYLILIFSSKHCSQVHIILACNILTIWLTDVTKSTVQAVLKRWDDQAHIRNHLLWSCLLLYTTKILQ